jgi:shikimate 5-dehydrogenase
MPLRWCQILEWDDQARPPISKIVCFPLETELLKCARALGYRTLNGGGMAVLQFAEVIRLFMEESIAQDDRHAIYGYGFAFGSA